MEVGGRRCGYICYASKTRRGVWRARAHTRYRFLFMPAILRHDGTPSCFYGHPSAHAVQPSFPIRMQIAPPRRVLSSELFVSLSFAENIRRPRNSRYIASDRGRKRTFPFLLFTSDLPRLRFKRIPSLPIFLRPLTLNSPFALPPLFHEFTLLKGAWRRNWKTTSFKTRDFNTEEFFLIGKEFRFGRR